VSEPEEAAISRQQLSKDTAATDTQRTVEELLEMVFSMSSVPRLCNNQWGQVSQVS
jgi:hypothetical protein